MVDETSRFRTIQGNVGNIKGNERISQTSEPRVTREQFSGRTGRILTGHDQDQELKSSLKVEESIIGS